MPIQVEDIIPEGAAQEQSPPQEEAQEEVQEGEAPPAPKRRGRHPGSKNKPKPPAGEVQDIEEAPKASRSQSRSQSRSPPQSLCA